MINADGSVDRDEEYKPSPKAQLIAKSILSQRKKGETIKEPVRGTTKTNTSHHSKTAEAARKILSGRFWSSLAAR